MAGQLVRRHSYAPVRLQLLARRKPWPEAFRAELRARFSGLRPKLRQSSASPEAEQRHGLAVYQRFLPSITSTGVASRSKSSSSCALTERLRLPGTIWKFSQTGVSLYVLQPHVPQK